MITEESCAISIQVILSRHEGKAGSAVGGTPTQVDDIIRKLTEKCKISTAPETVVAKLNATEHTGDITKFTEQRNMQEIEISKKTT